MPSRRHFGSTLHCRGTTNTNGSHGGQGAWKGGGIMNAENSHEKDMTLQQAHRGIGAMAGPATGESYSCGGSDEEGGWGHNSGSAIQDAAQALLGASSAANSYHNNKNRRGSAEKRASNRKGHEAEIDLPPWKGVGVLWTTTKRLVNSYASALSKQQRERARRMSSAKNLLADTVDPDDVESGNGSHVGTSEGIPRSRSSTTVGYGLSSGEQHGSSSAADVSVELAQMMESGNGGHRVDGGGLVGGGDAVAAMPDKGAGGERGSMATRTLRRGGRSRNTTGNLVRLLRDEEQQGAGEDSAQEYKKGGRFRRGKRPLPGGGEVSARSSVEDWRADDWTDRSFKVLGVEIGHMSESGVAAVLVSGIFAFLLVYGYMQEYLVVEVFNRELGLFLTLLQFFGYAAYAASARALHNEHKRKIPLKTYFRLGFLQACMQGMTNVSMMYLNYPAKVLFKSSRMVPIMCFGVIWQGRKYSWRDYIVVFFIVTGLATFMNAETRASEESETPFSLIGVVFISLALVIDAALINIQEELMNKYDSCQDELIMYSYLCGTVFVATFCLLTGDLRKGVLFLHHQGIRAMMAVMLYAGAGFLGVSCVAALTKRFGALHSAITTTARKAVTLLLSFVVFPNKPFSTQHGVGAVVFILGLVTKASGKKSKSKVPAGQSTSTSPGATPFVQISSRKRLPSGREPSSSMFDTRSTTPLLSDGSGAGCNGVGHAVNVSGGDVDRTHSPSPVNPEGSGASTGISGGYPVRHRGSSPKSPFDGVVSVGGVEEAGEEHGNGRRDGYGVRRQRAAEGVTETTPSWSPRRRPLPLSPPVTGLGLRS